MASHYAITPDHAYHLGSCCIFAELLRDCLWDIREKYILIQKLPAEIRRCLNSRQYYHCHVGFQKLYDVYTSVGDIKKDDCDITVLYSILRNICTNIKAPQQTWGRKPSASNIEIADDIERIRIGRNTFLGHVNKASMSKDEFEKLIAEVRHIVRRIDMLFNSNKYMAGLDHIKEDCKDLSKMKDYKNFHDMLQEQLTYERENREEIAEVKKEIKENKQKFEKHGVEISERKKESDENRQNIDRHGVEISERKKETDENKQELERHGVEISERKKETDENKQKLDRHGVEISERKKETDENKQKLDRHGVEISERKKESDENRQKLDRHGVEISERKKETDENRQKLERHGVEISERKKETDENKQKLDRHGVEISERKKETDENKQKLERHGVEIAEVKKEFTSVKRKREEGGQWKAEKRRMGAEEEAGAAKLKEDILKGYQEDFDTVFETQLTDGVSAIHMFSPIIFREDLENQFSDNSPVSQMASAAASRISHHSGKVKQIQSYRDIFFKDGQLQTLVVLLGEAGVGKTTFCNHIVNLWCLVQTEDCQRDFTENDQALINVLTQFEYLFVVRCRDTNEHISVLSMIKGMFCSKKDDIHIDNIFRYNTEQCLVIIDGLDEWMYTSSVGRGKTSLDVLPDCTKIRGATIIMTSRPWKVEALPRKSLRGCRVLQIEGLDMKGIKNLTHKFIEALRPSVTDHETLCESFLREVDEQEMGDIVKQPLLLRSIIESWLSRNHKLHRSLTMNYAGLINSVVSHSGDKLSDKDKTLAEHQEKESLPGCFKEMKTCLTHSGIFRKISALAFKTLVLKEKERSLVFSKKDLIDEVGEDCLDLCLKLGILSETKASSLARVKHVTLSFIHKSVQELFAAVHLSEDEAGLCLTEFTSKLNSLNEVFDHALILKFLFGMSQSKGQTILNHVYGVVDQCSEIKAYRQCADCTLSDRELDHVCIRLNQLYESCAVELIHTASSPISQHTSSESNLYIPDVLLRNHWYTPSADVNNLMFCRGGHIKSLLLNKSMLIVDIVESLESMQNIEKLVVVVSHYHAYKVVDLIIQSLSHLKHLQSFKLGVSSSLFDECAHFVQQCETRNPTPKYYLSVLQTTSLFTELGKLTNLVSLALYGLDLTPVEKVEIPNHLKSLYLSDMTVTSDLLACLLTSCTTVTLACLRCKGDLVFPSTCTSLDCRNVSCTGTLVFPSICTTLNIGKVSCRGRLKFPLVCPELNLKVMSLQDLAVLPDSLTSLDMYDVTLTQAAGEQLCRGLRSTSTLHVLRFHGHSDHMLYLHEHLDLSSYLSLHTLKLGGGIVLDSCGVVVPHNVREIEIWQVTMSEEYWYQLVQNIYTCHNVRAGFYFVTINEATLKYIHQHFIVTRYWELSDEEETYISEDEETDITDEEETDITYDEETYITDEEETDITDKEETYITDKEDIYISAEEETDISYEEDTDITEKEETEITDEKNNDRTDGKNGFTTVRRQIDFHTKCPEHNFTI